MTGKASRMCFRATSTTRKEQQCQNLTLKCPGLKVAVELSNQFKQCAELIEREIG
jgi:hypothetical protein